MSVIQQNQSVNDMEVEQQKSMREWMLNQLQDNELQFFEGVFAPQNKREVLYINLRRIGVKGTIIVIKNEEYTPWYSLNKLASLVGYSEPKSMFKEKGLLYGYEHKLLKNLLGEFTPEEIIDPEDIQANKHTSNMSSIYIPHKVASILMILAGQQEKFRDQSKILTNLMDKIDVVTNKVITKLNHIIAEYRHQENERKLKLYESRKEQIDAALQNAFMLIQDIKLKKNLYLYMYTNEEHSRRMLRKVGITDKDPRIRLNNLNNGDNTYGGEYEYILEVYDNKLTEKFIEKIFKTLKLHHEGEWYRIPTKDIGIRIIDALVSGINNAYDAAMEIPATIRSILQEQLQIEGIPERILIPEEPELPNKKFIEKICEKIGVSNGKTIVNKTALLNAIRDVKKRDEFKTTKTKLPIDIDSFLEQKITGISIKKEQKGRAVQITIEIIQE